MKHFRERTDPVLEARRILREHRTSRRSSLDEAQDMVQRELDRTKKDLHAYITRPKNNVIPREKPVKKITPRVKFPLYLYDKNKYTGEAFEKKYIAMMKSQNPYCKKKPKRHRKCCCHPLPHQLGFQVSLPWGKP